MEWFKSSRCQHADCVEVKFIRSSRCEAHNCLEVALGERVLIRDSKEVEPEVLNFPKENWQRFVVAINNQEF